MHARHYTMSVLPAWTRGIARGAENEASLPKDRFGDLHEIIIRTGAKANKETL
jgi:hypothetical protein